MRATLPAVGAAIGDIADRFYERLFAAHPELLRDLFNRGNQASGTQRRALAGSIAAFATHLVERPDERPDVLLNRIAHKHASLGIAPEQYAIVREHLFAAIAEVLGDAVTPEVAAAWDEVYWLMARRPHRHRAPAVRTARRREGRVAALGGRGTRRGDRRRRHLPAAPGRRGPLPDFRAGQYVSVRVELPDGAHQIRQYSLSSAPGSPYGRSASSGYTAASRNPTARSPTTSTRVYTSAARSSSPRPTAIWCSTTRTRRYCSPPPASVSPR